MSHRTLRRGCLGSLVASGLLITTGVLAERYAGVSERAGELYGGVQDEIELLQLRNALQELPDSVAYALVRERLPLLDYCPR